MGSVLAVAGRFPPGTADEMGTALAYRAPCWALRASGEAVVGAGAATGGDSEAMVAETGQGWVVADAPVWMRPETPPEPTVESLLRWCAQMQGDAHCVGALPGAVIAYRGPVSTRPLFYACSSRGLLVATRPGAIVEVEPTRIGKAGLAPYLVPQLCDPQGSPWVGVRRLAPGQALVWQEGHLALRDVATVRTEDVADATSDDVVGLFRERMCTAVSRTSGASDALLLSGGIDSSALAAAYRATAAGPVAAYGLTYEPPLDPCDERRYAYDVAESTPMPFSALPANDLLPLGCAYPVTDEPEPWAYAGRNWALLEHIANRPHPPSTIVAGEGGDELLLGQIFSAADRLARGDVSGQDELQTFPDPQAANRVVHRLLDGAYDTPAARFDRALRDLPPWFTRRWLEDAGVLDRLSGGYPRLGPPGHMGTTYSQALIAEAGAAGRVQCGGWWEDVGRRTGMEIVYPFLDPDVVALSWALPPHLLRQGGYEKAVLRRAFAPELPASVAARRDKAEALAVLHAGLNANAHRLHALTAQSPLIDHGILDPVGLKSGIANYFAGKRRLGPALWAVAAVDEWMRDVKGVPE